MNDKTETPQPYLFELKGKYGKRYRRMKYIFILMGVFWTAAGVIELISGGTRFYHFVLLIGGPLFIIQAIISEKNQKDHYIVFNNDFVEFKQSWRKAVHLSWQDIGNIQIKNLEVVLYDSSNVPYSIKLDELEFANVKILKEKLEIFAEHKEKPISHS